jgi:hypothetical protein
MQEILIPIRPHRLAPGGKDENDPKRRLFPR